MTTPIPTTTALFVFCTNAVLVQMNATLGQIDPTNVGDIITTPVALRTDPATVVGRFTSWRMNDGERSAILRAYAQQGWRPLRGSEGTVHQPGDAIPAWGSQRFYMLDGTTFTKDAALGALGLTDDIAGGDE